MCGNKILASAAATGSSNVSVTSAVNRPCTPSHCIIWTRASNVRLSKAPSISPGHPDLPSCIAHACRSGRRTRMHTCTCSLCLLVCSLCSACPPLILLTVMCLLNGPNSIFLTGGSWRGTWYGQASPSSCCMSTLRAGCRTHRVVVLMGCVSHPWRSCSAHVDGRDVT